MSLKVDDLHKHFDDGQQRVDVLRGISFRLQAGDAVAVTGPSGCGKSTLLHCLGTLTHPSAGTILIDDQDPFQLPEPELARFRNARVGFVFQDHHLLPQYSVLENTVLPAMAFPGPAAEAEERAVDLLERVGLSHRIEYRPAPLSGGERQRVAVARALVNQPHLLLCDEPTGNLDEETAQSVAELLFELHRERQTVLIVVTHSLTLAEMFPRRFQLKGGRCVEA